MGPVIAILVGALLIATGILASSRLGTGIGIILAIAGVATLIIGLVMLFNLARQDTGKTVR